MPTRARYIKIKFALEKKTDAKQRMNPSRPKRQRLGFESGFLSKRMKRVKLRENDADERRRAFKTPEHASDVLGALRRLRDTNAMCDIELSVANRTFRAHKLVLVATIPYLKAMLSSGMRESRQETIELKSIDPDAFETILDYAYTGEVVVSDENVQDLLPAASMLQIESLRDACCKFLEEQIEPGNCLGIGSFADVHGCVELVEEVDRFVCRRFVDVARCEEFLGLGWEDAKGLLMKDGLQVRRVLCTVVTIYYFTHTHIVCVISSRDFYYIYSSWFYPIFAHELHVYICSGNFRIIFVTMHSL